MLPDEELGAVRERFLRFVSEAAGQSPLYERLSEVAAGDAVAIELVAGAPDAAQRRPNLLFAAVHDLLLAGWDHPLAAYYPTLGGTRLPDAGADAAFRELLRSARPELEHRIEARATQTNEVGRCAALWPALRFVADHAGARMGLVELGASAGLLLHLDRYRYVLGDEESGDPTSPAVIEPVIVGDPPRLTASPDVAGRIGIDLSPLDPGDPEDARWLQACVWPEELARHARLRRALDVAGQHPDVELVAGDLTTEIATVVEDIHSDVLPVVLHSAALAYLGADARQGVAAALEELGAERDLAWISLEGPLLPPFSRLSEEAAVAPEEPCFLLGLTLFRDGQRTDTLLARSHPHGHWLQWLERSAS